MSQVHFDPSPDNPHTLAPAGHTLSFNELKSIYLTLANKDIPSDAKAQAAQAAEAHRDETLPLLRFNMLIAAISFVACAGALGLEVTGDMDALLARDGFQMSRDFKIVTYPILLSVGTYSFLTLINSAKAYYFMNAFYENHTPQTHQGRALRSEEQDP